MSFNILKCSLLCYLRRVYVEYLSSCVCLNKKNHYPTNFLRKMMI